MRGVISDVHAAGNDRFDFFPPFVAEILRSFFAVNKFFDKLSPAVLHGRALFC